MKKSNDPYVQLAIDTIENYIRNNTLPSTEGLSDELLNNEAGTFVSLKKNGELRGCIGTILPTTDSIAEEIIQNAISASTRDPRFLPVREDELDDLTYSVDVLLKPEPINSLDQLDVKRYGVIVTNGGRRGLLLPDLEGVDTPEQQVMIAMQKAGIAPGEVIDLDRFEVIRHVE